MSIFDYLKDYDNCLDYCGNPPSLEEEDCIKDIKDEYGNEELCMKSETLDIAIIHTPQFEQLLSFLVKFLKILYCCRYYNGNIYDAAIISSLGLLDLNDFGLTTEELKSVKLQNFVKKGMPDNLGDYFVVMREIKQIMLEEEPLEITANSNPILQNYSEFVSDYQPWSRLLYSCVDKYVKELGILPEGIPDITKKSNYGTFISDCTEEEINKIIEELTENPTYIIRFVREMQGGNLFLKK